MKEAILELWPSATVEELPGNPSILGYYRFKVTVGEVVGYVDLYPMGEDGYRVVDWTTNLPEAVQV